MTPIGLAVAKRARAISAAAQDLADIAARARLPMTGLLEPRVIPTIVPFPAAFREPGIRVLAVPAALLRGRRRSCDIE
jgi:hypothetical protein